MEKYLTFTSSKPQRKETMKLKKIFEDVMTN